MQTFKRQVASNPGAKVFAEVGKTTRHFPDRDCVAIAEGNKDVVNAVVLFEVENGCIKRFDLCIPELLRPVRSGQYPSKRLAA